MKSKTLRLLAAIAILVVLALPVRMAAAQETLRYTITDLGTLGGSFSGPINLSNRGQVVGVSAFAGDNTVGGFFWQNGVMSGLPSLGGPQTGASDIGRITTS